MRILILNSLYPTPLHPKILGGAEKSVRNLAEALVREGHQVEVIRGAAPGTKETLENVNGVDIYAAPIKNLYWPFGDINYSAPLRLIWHLIDDAGFAPAAVNRRIKDFKPDVIHTNNLSGLTTEVWKIAKRRGIRVVHTLRDYYLLCPKAKYYKNGSPCGVPCLACKSLTMVRRQRTELPDAVVGNSHATLKLHLIQGLFDSVAAKVAIGSLADPDAEILPRRSKESGGATTFGYIGRVVEEKGIEQLAEAYARFPAGRANLVIAGETDPEVQAKLTIAASGRPIKFMGFVPPKNFYEAVDIVVAPSLWHEPLPRSVIDAIAYGRPVIGSTRGGIPESMGTPPFGWIFDPDERDGLFKAMQAAMGTDLPRPSIVTSDPLESYQRIYVGGGLG